MQFGINFLLWTDSPNDGKESAVLYENAKKIGYDLVELPVYTQPVNTMKNIGKILDDLNLDRTAVTTCAEDANLISPDAQIRRGGVDYLKATLDRCAAAGCRILVGPLHSAIGCFSGRGPTDDEFKWGVEGMKQVAEYAEKVNVRLALEAINRFECYFMTCAEQAAKFVAAVNHPFCGTMYDTFHANIEEQNIQKAVDTLQKTLIHVHISENDRSTPGSGLILWAENFDALHRINYQGAFVIEAFSGSLPNIAAATKIWRRMFKDETQLVTDGIAFMKSEVAKRW